jgi:hypothetical protein
MIDQPTRRGRVLGGGLRLELRLDVNPYLLSATRRYIEQSLAKYIADSDLVWRAGMAAHELLENAAKYAPLGVAALAIVIDRGGPEPTLTIRLSNNASVDDLERLQRFWDEITDSKDVRSLYVDFMRRSALISEGSGLGLARIRVEGEMTLGLHIEGQRATIVATTKIPALGA